VNLSAANRPTVLLRDRRRLRCLRTIGPENGQGPFSRPARPNLGRRHLDWSEVAGIYVVGGGGSFPLVARMLRSSFDTKRLKRSPHHFAAAAIGRAAFLDKEADFALSERLSRHFGVFHEAHGGQDVIFDPILPKDVALPADGQPPLVVTRTYRAAHNIDASGSWGAAACSTAAPKGT
jgi:hypothetical protein